MYVRCIKSLNKANKQYRKRSIKQVTSEMLLAFIIWKMEEKVMICAEFERTKEGWKVDVEWLGYGNANIFEAFKMEGIDLQKVLDSMKIGELKIYNIGWWNGCGIAKRGIKPEIVKFG